ncbi:MAG: YcxB family protein [Verrucomicrobia bacterium]|nr:YcxB family protein [Verrucomicrobiota bacterium]
MSSGTSNNLQITTQPTFWESYIASLKIIRYQGWIALFHAPFPIASVLLLMTPMMGYRLGVVEMLAAAFGISFTPLFVAIGVWSRRRNQLARGAFTYTFDSEGMHASGSVFDQTIRWPAIPRIRLSGRFLFIFISPISALFIPIRSLTLPEQIEQLRNIAAHRTDFR